MKTALSLLLALTMLSGGCAKTFKTSDEVAMAATVQRDNYQKSSWVNGPRIHYGDSYNECFLRTLVTDDGRRVNQLYVLVRPRDWVFLDRASDIDGRRLDVRVIDRDVSRSATITEHVAVVLDDGYLRQAATKGLNIQVVGNRGRTRVLVPPHYVQGFLARLDSTFPS